MIEQQATLIKKVKQGKQWTLTFKTKAGDKPFQRGESVSVDGVCLTVAGRPKGKQFSVQVVRETYEQTTLDSLRNRAKVNLERSLKWGERMGGQ